VVFDNAGNLYGTTYGYSNGNEAPYGTVYELTPSGSGWMKKILYTFQGANDGGTVPAGLVADQSGNLYGATISYGTGGGGTAFRLTQSGGVWTFQILYSFVGTLNGGPQESLAMNTAGNLYGTAIYDGAHGSGSIFRLTHSGSSWSYSSLHDFTAGSDGGNPISGVVFDRDGNLYGTAYLGGVSGRGVVWQVTP